MTAIETTNDGTAVAFYDYHHSMVTDRVRSEAFLKAIVNTVKPGDVVIDLGTGTGLLSLFALTAGARKVYAIEQEVIVEIAKQVAQVNGVSDQIEFVVGKSTDIELPELADVLITETIGNAGFDEGILTWMADARSRLLKPDARLIPNQLNLICSLLELPRDYDEINKLSSPLYTFDVSPLRDLVNNRVAWDEVSPVSVVSEPLVVMEADLYTAPTSLAGTCLLTARRDVTVHAVGVWFDATLSAGVKLTNRPRSTAPSWDQGVFMLEKPIELNAGHQARVGVEVSDDGATWSYDVERM